MEFRKIIPWICSCLIAAGCSTSEIQSTDASVDTNVGDSVALPDQAPLGPTSLADTGLYSDFASRTLAPGVIRYTPRYPLWSDGAEKERYLLLPPGTQIDTTDMDNWVFPVGTKAWKQFTVDSTVVETRLLYKAFDDPKGWWNVAYLWNSDHTEALATTDGADNVLGTAHKVPSQEDCGKCHGNVRDVIIGVSAIQLSSSSGNGSLSQLAVTHLLSAPPTAEFQLPGQGIVQDALGYLHGNCGHCHNDNSFFASKSVLRLRLGINDQIPEQTPTYKSSINVKMFHNMPPDIDLGVVPGAPEKSQLYVRMGSRDDWAMPPVCTKIADQTGLSTVASWINSLPH